jgi:hypothetical protein
MKLQPLNQWICDHCGKVIDKSEHGCLEWLSEKMEDQYLNHGFKLVHNKQHSPRNPESSCYFYDIPPQEQLKMDLPLSDFIGVNGMVILLAFIDTGPFLEEPFCGPHVADLREWTELVRRLMLPYYEEARLYMDRANTDGFFKKSNEALIYFPQTLKEVIRLYGGR